MKCRTVIQRTMYRAPETKPGTGEEGYADKVYDGKKVDIFNCGVILFMLRMQQFPMMMY